MLSGTGVVRKYQYDQKAERRQRRNMKDRNEVNHIKTAMETSPLRKKMKSGEK